MYVACAHVKNCSATVLHVVHRPRSGVAARIHDLSQTAVITVLTKYISLYIYVYVAVVCAFQHVLCRYAATRVYDFALAWGVAARLHALLQTGVMVVLVLGGYMNEYIYILGVYGVR